MFDCNAIVAGAGIWGCTLSRRLAEAGRKVLVLEKRPAVGGNVRCEIDPETGIEIHRYGSHIFHTHIPEVWEFVNRFVKFNGYQHKVLANYQGKIYNLPLGLGLINKFFNVELKPGEVTAFMKDEVHSSAIFDAFFRGYTSKQWGKAPEDIDPAIIQRVPVRSNYDTNYFNDYNQGIPTTGYNSLFERLLDHPNITVQCNCALSLDGVDDEVKVRGEGEQWINSIFSSKPQVYYSGPIDALFNYKFGYLPWRTLRFEAEALEVQDYQGTSVVNYTEAEVPYTRVHEFKHYHPEFVGEKDGKPVRGWGFDAPKTIVMREYSATWHPGDEPYYPVNNADSAWLLARYQVEVEKINRRDATASCSCRLTVGGRLGGYKYYDMDKAMEDALNMDIGGRV